MNLNETNNRDNFFKNCKTIDGKTELNTDIWNNKEVHKMTFYTIEDIK